MTNEATVEKVKIKSESSASSKAVVKKKEVVPEIPAHLAAILAMKKASVEQEPVSEEPEVKSFYKAKNEIEPDPDRSLISANWDKSDRLVLEFDDGEKIVTEPVPVRGSSSSVIVTGSGSNPSPVADTYETVNKNLSAIDALYNYNISGTLTSIIYANGVTKTFNYTADKLTSIVLSGSTPSGIDLIKSLSYVGDNLSLISYS